MWLSVVLLVYAAILGVGICVYSSYGSHNGSQIGKCLQHSLLSALAVLDQPTVLLYETQGGGCGGFGPRKGDMSVIMESFCDIKHLEKVFNAINHRKEITIIITTRSACIGTVLSLITQSDDAHNQHGYFTFAYKWILVTDFYNATAVEHQASNIIHLTVITCQTGLIHSPLMLHLGWGKLPQRQTHIGHWPPNTTDGIFPMRKYGLNGVQLTVTVNMGNPFLIKDKFGRYSGMTIDLLEVFAGKLNFSYVFMEPPDRGWGVERPNGSWTGLVGQMQRKEADMVCAPLTRGYHRNQVMDFVALSYHTEYRGFGYKRPDPGSTLFGVLTQPLKRDVWLCVVSAIAITAGALWVTGFMEMDATFNNKWRCLFYSFATILQQGSPRSPRSCAGRILTASMWFSAITLAAVYSGNLTAFLAVSNINTPFKTLEDIAQQTDYQVGFTAGTYLAMFFKTTTKEPYMTIAKQALRSVNKNRLTNDFNDDLERIRRGQYIHIAGYTSLLPVESCAVSVMKTRLEEKYSFGLRKNSALTPLVDKVMALIYETGLMDRIHSKYEEQHADLSACSTYNHPGSVQMKLQSMTGIMLLVGSCLLLSAILLAVENVFYFFKKFHML